MKQLINMNKLRIHQAYNGKVDVLYLHQDESEYKVFGERLDYEWKLISKIFLDLDYIKKGFSTDSFTRNFLMNLHKNTDEESYQFITDQIPYYKYFQDICDLLLLIKGWTSDDSDATWAGYDSGLEFKKDLEIDIEKIRFCDFECLKKLYIEFAPASTYQEISLASDWSQSYLKLSEEFDFLYKKIIQMR